MKIQKTKVSPYILIDYDNGIIEIKGRSIMTNVAEFYEPINYLIKKLCEKEIDINMYIDLEYFNTSSSKEIFNIFNILSKIIYKVDINIYWYFEEDDEDIEHSGIDYSSMFKKLKFNLIPKYD